MQRSELAEHLGSRYPWRLAGRVSVAEMLPIVVLLVAVFVGVLAVLFPGEVATVAFGALALLVVVAPRLRFASFLIVVCLAPLSAYVKAFTGLNYGPVILDVSTVVICVLTIGTHVSKRSFRLDLPTGVVMATMILGLIQFFNPLGPGFGYAAYGYRFFILPFIGFLIGRYLVTSESQLRIAVKTMFIIAIFVAAYGARQSLGLNEYDLYIVRSTMGDPSSYTSLGANRVFSTMSGPFHLAYFMSSMILLMAVIFTTSGIRVRLLFPLLLMAIVLVLTIVRSSWFGLAGGLTFLVLSHLYLGRARRILFVRLAAVVLLVVGVAIALTFMSSTIASLSEATGALGAKLVSLTAPIQDKNFQMRFASWGDRLIPAILSNPLGHGVGSDASADWASFYAHNGFIYVAIELGVPGLSLVVYLLIWGLRRGLAIARCGQTPFLRRTGLWVSAWIVASMIQAITGPLIEVYPVNLYLWFVLGSLVALFPSRPARQQPATKETPVFDATKLLPKEAV